MWSSYLFFIIINFCDSINFDEMNEIVVKFYQQDFHQGLLVRSHLMSAMNARYCSFVRCASLSPAPCHAPSWSDGRDGLATPKTLENLVSVLRMKQLHVFREPTEDNGGSHARLC